MTPRDRTRAGGRGWLRSAFTDRWQVKLAALALAIVLWLVVRAEEPTEVVLAARFVPLVDSTLVLMSEPPATLQVVVTGRTREVLKLYTNPPVLVRSFDVDTRLGVPVRVALSPADVDFPTGVEARAREVRPRSVTLIFGARAGRAARDSSARRP